MSRRALILRVRPLLVFGEEALPRARVARRAVQGQRGHIGREALVEPKPVPPFHRDQVAEPHVRHLVQDRRSRLLALLQRLRRAGDVALAERHGADVLHRALVEVRHDDLVVLLERIRQVEVAAVKIQALPRQLEPLLGGHVLRERLAREKTQGDRPGRRGPDVVRAGVDREHVGAEPRGPRERPLPALAGERRFLLSRGRDDAPVRGRVHAERVRRLQVRLVEAREEPVRVVRLEVRVQVHPAVLGVLEAVQARAVDSVGVRIRELHDVDARAQALLRKDEERAGVVGRGDALAVDRQGLEVAALEVHGQVVGRSGEREAQGLASGVILLVRVERQ